MTLETRQKVLKTFCTSQEAAKILGVSQRTVQLWVESGLLEAWKTLGGHRRIARQSIEGLLASPPIRNIGIEPQPKDEAGTDSASARPFSILVVEDDADLRRLYEVNLTRWPMHPVVVTAGDGYEALIRMGYTTPDLLVLDLNMPGMDGFRMLKTIRNVPELAATVVVIVTGLDPMEVKRRGDAPEGILVLPKPIPFDQLKAFAMQLVDKKTTEGSTP